MFGLSAGVLFLDRSPDQFTRSPLVKFGSIGPPYVSIQTALPLDKHLFTHM